MVEEFVGSGLPTEGRRSCTRAVGLGAFEDLEQCAGVEGHMGSGGRRTPAMRICLLSS